MASAEAIRQAAARLRNSPAAVLVRNDLAERDALYDTPTHGDPAALNEWRSKVIANGTRLAKDTRALLDEIDRMAGAS